MKIISGYLVIFALYFLVRAVQFHPLVLTEGVVTGIGINHYEVEGKTGGPVAMSNEYPIVEYKAGDSGSAVRVLDNKDDQSFIKYKVGDKVTVAYNPDAVSKALVYSLREYWLPVPVIAILIFACVLWTIIYVSVKYKPWKFNEAK